MLRFNGPLQHKVGGQLEKWLLDEGGKPKPQWFLPLLRERGLQAGILILMSRAAELGSSDPVSENLLRVSLKSLTPKKPTSDPGKKTQHLMYVSA